MAKIRKVKNKQNTLLPARIKIFLTCRNRFEMTKKCIEAIKKHSKIPHQLYIYDNLTNYRVEDHWGYFCGLYKKNLITKYVVNTNESTFNAFSKAVASNEFGYLHIMDPNWEKYAFLVFLDNDVLVLPEWDVTIKRAWEDVQALNLKDIKVIEQAMHGGIKGHSVYPRPIGGVEAITGKLGGSGFWTTRSNFFKEVGFLDISKLVGYNKKHDQNYWQTMNKLTSGKPYIMGLRKWLIYHCGTSVAPSICNELTRNRNNDITFKESDEKIKTMNLEQLLEFVKPYNEKQPKHLRQKLKRYK